jgi:hypothetical protein
MNDFAEYLLVVQLLSYYTIIRSVSINKKTLIIIRSLVNLHPPENGAY